jgi:hypothetical protein
MQNKRCFIRLAPARIVVLCKIFALRVPQKHRFWRVGFVQVYFIEMLEKSGGIGLVPGNHPCRFYAFFTGLNLPKYRKKSVFFGGFSVFFGLLYGFFFANPKSAKFAWNGCF